MPDYAARDAVKAGLESAFGGIAGSSKYNDVASHVSQAVGLIAAGGILRVQDMQRLHGRLDYLQACNRIRVHENANPQPQPPPQP